jgi:DNA-binding SARP family transcriptional activator
VPLTSPDQPLVYEYLATEVLRSQPADRQAFLLDACAAPLLSVDLCEHGLGLADSDRHLPQLVRRGLFVSATDQTPRTYELHPLFRELLLTIAAEQDAARLQGLRRLAAVYLEQAGKVAMAFDLYLEAGEIQNALALASSACGELFHLGRLETLIQWAARLESHAEPPVGLTLTIASGLIDRGVLDSAEDHLTRAVAGLSRDDPADREHLARAETLRAHICLERRSFQVALRTVDGAEALLARRPDALRSAACKRIRARAMHGLGRDLEAAAALAGEAADLLRDAGESYTLGMTLIDMALINQTAGLPLEAEKVLIQARAMMEPQDAPIPLAIIYNNLGFLMHRAGRYDEALDYYAFALREAHRGASSRYEAAVLFGQADLFCDIGLAYPAAELYGQGLRLAAQLNNPVLSMYGFLGTSVLHHRWGERELAEEWLMRAQSVVVGEPSAALTLQRAALAPDAGSSVDGDPQVGFSPADRTAWYGLLADSALRRDERGVALEALRKALKHAGLSGSHQVLAAEFRWNTHLYEFAIEALPDNAVLAVINERVQTMRAIAQRGEGPSREEVDADLRLCGLGGVRAYHEGELLRALEPLPRQLLFFLVDRGPVERDVVLEAIWPGASAERQTSSLYTARHHLRRALGRDLVVTDGTSYRIAAEISVQYDVGLFEHAADIAERTALGDPRRLFALTEALHAYSGEFLPEYASDWVVERRWELEARYVDLLSIHASEAENRGQYELALESLRRALELDPLRDDLTLRTMDVLGQLGRRSDVVALYRRYTDQLSRELGLDPPQEARELYARLIG